MPENKPDQVGLNAALGNVIIALGFTDKLQAASKLPADLKILNEMHAQLAEAKTLIIAAKKTIQDLAANAATISRDHSALLAIVNSPILDDFLQGTRNEAAHQVVRWGSAHDAGKEPPDWFWALGFLAGKALAASARGDIDKAKHHTISSAALLLNWHAHLCGEPLDPEASMRPGKEPPT